MILIHQLGVTAVSIGASGNVWDLKLNPVGSSDIQKTIVECFTYEFVLNVLSMLNVYPVGICNCQEYCEIYIKDEIHFLCVCQELQTICDKYYLSHP